MFVFMSFKKFVNIVKFELKHFFFEIYTESKSHFFGAEFKMCFQSPLGGRAHAVSFKRGRKYTEAINSKCISSKYTVICSS